MSRDTWFTVLAIVWIVLWCAAFLVFILIY